MLHFSKSLGRQGVLSASLMLLMVGGAAAGDDAGGSWSDGIKYSGHLEAGYTYNGSRPSDGLNFGSLFTDRNDSALLNQFMLTAEKPLDPARSTERQFGFKLQGMYGSDSRYTHFLGEFDNSLSGRNQLDVVEAYLNFHAPILTKEGVDLKVGQYVTLEGAEVIDATGNFFYSHSYIFNFGIPFKHTGVMATTHLGPMLDIYTGVDTGVNTTFGSGDNNSAAAFHGGFGLNFLGGDLTVLATTHIGPENPDTALFRANFPGVNPNGALRYLNDITTVWKVNKKLTLTNDLNYIRDDGLAATGYGVAQYASYAINDWLSLGVRGEIWRDNNGAFVAAFPGNSDFVNAEKGLPNTSIAGAATTYAALTVGANIKPTVPKTFEGTVIRPELRWDNSTNSKAFNAGTSNSQFTAGIDLIVPFTK